jgi:DNA-binding NarL/FixJ family response regulator
MDPRRSAGSPGAKQLVSPKASQAVNSRKSRPEDTVRLAIATQPTLVLDALSRCFSREEGIEVVGEGADEDKVAQVLKETTPEVLLFDSEALGPNSESIIGRLRRLAPHTRILVIATRSADDNVERVLRAGAAGLVGKQLGFETVVRAIRAVASGEIWANRRAQALTLEHLTNFAAGVSEPEVQVTRREQQIVDGVSRGLRNKEIARQLSISEKTVKSHLNNIFQKLGIEGRFALARFDQHSSHPKT